MLKIVGTPKLSALMAGSSVSVVQTDLPMNLKLIRYVFLCSWYCLLDVPLSRLVLDRVSYMLYESLIVESHFMSLPTTPVFWFVAG